MNAVIYTRVSSDEQVKNLSLDTQQRQCLDYCRRHALEAVQTFVERGESAKTVNRPEFQKMLAYCRQHRGKVQFVIVYNLSRFSRQTHDHLAIRGLLAGLGISLRSVNEQIDESSTGKFLESVLAAVNQLDNDMRSERTKAGMQAALAKGRWTHQAPIGYLNAGKNLVPDPERAPFVRKAFELMQTRMWSQTEARRKLNAEGFRTVKSKLPISAQTFTNLLRNPLYAGQLTGFDGTVTTAASFEPLVSLEQFQQVQTILDGKAPTFTPHVRARADFPLRWIVRCEFCTKPLTGSYSTGRQKTKYGYYHCRCGKVRASVHDLERAFTELLESLAPQPECLNILNEVILDIWKQKESEINAETARIARSLVELRKRKDKLDDAVIERLIDRPTYQAKLDALNEQIALAEIAAHDAKLDTLDIDGTLKISSHILLNAARLWRELPAGSTGNLVQLFFPHGLTFDGKRCRTSATHPIFNLLQPSPATKSKMATLMVASWKHVFDWIRAVVQVAAIFEPGSLWTERVPRAEVGL